MKNRSKVSIIGAGGIGASCAQRIVEKGYADVVLLSATEGLAQGKVLDIVQSSPILNISSHLIGTNGYQDTADSDVVIFARGMTRKPGMSRDELLEANMRFVTEAIPNIVNYSPGCIIIEAINPLDAMTYLALHASQLPRNRVFGVSGVIDCARLRCFIAAELDVSVEDVFACILGQHGDNMVVIPRLCTVGGIPITELLPQEAIDKLVKRTVGGGAEIISLLKTSSAVYPVSAGVIQMAEAIILDKKKILPCAAYLDGEYGIKGNVISVPVKLGTNGIEQIIELRLTEEEKAQLVKSANSVQQLISMMKLS